MAREKGLENENFSRSWKNQGILVWAGEIRKTEKSQGFSENWDGYGSLFNF